MTKEFYKLWKRKTKLEEQAIKSLKSARKMILKNIPNREIFAIYVKGSFIRREMNQKSDVDMVVIIKENKNIKKVEKVSKKSQNKYNPKVGISVHSLWELKKNKHFGKTQKLRAKPDLFIKKVKHYKLIFGEKIAYEKYPSRTDKENLKARIKAFKEIFIPYYQKKKMGFGELIKQVFWIVELEQEINGHNPPHHWKRLAKSIKDKKHIIHETLKLRLTPNKDKKIRNAYWSEFGHVNPWGGVEAMLTHALSLILNKPVAHAPMAEDHDELDEDLGCVIGVQAAEAISMGFSFCILKGLHKSPSICNPIGERSE